MNQFNKGMLSTMKKFRKNPEQTFKDTLNNLIDNRYVFKVSDKETIKILEEKVKELEKEL